MEPIRIVPRNVLSAEVPCSRCHASGERWDRLMGKAFCPDCEESLATGEGEPLIERTEKNRCCVCHQTSTLRYLTFPLNAAQAIEMDLCAEHFRALLGRWLRPAAFQQIRRQLQMIEIAVEDVFLLHDAFYDSSGRALQPAVECD